MRYASIVTGALATAVLAVPLAAPAMADSSSPASVGAEQGEHVRGDGSREFRGGHEEKKYDSVQLQKALDAIAEAGAPGVVAEVRDADGVWRGHSGKADLEKNEPTRNDGLFRIGSVTKTFVSTVVLQLVEEGKVKLDDSVDRHLPGLVKNGENVTVRQLLNHRSGLHSYTDTLWPDFRKFYDTRFKTYTPDELIADSNAHAPTFAPGTNGHYSNTNYVLLGMLIEKVTGNSAKAEIRERIIEPLDLHRTSFPEKSTRINGPHAKGYMRLDGPTSTFTEATDYSTSWSWTAGAMISDTRDLNTFYNALMTGKLLPSALMKEMKATQALDDGSQYGLGIAKFDSPSLGTVYGHVGGTPGFETHAFTLADGSRQVTVSINALADTDAEKKAAGEAVKTLLTLGSKAK
ncbi:serine hydrolase domain-containing protein [Streptomyces sp. NPDC056527]|uniref:serine hydrolase domain-containing protein n=1 Tax=Streptomyces sp. NPDC056527 TaxID=3345853 RepID=UPI0036A368A2